MRMKPRYNIPASLQRLRPYFEVLSRTSDVYYYIMDVESRVTILSENWVKDFGMGRNVISDMDAAWMPHIHPDDVEGLRKKKEEVLLHRKETRINTDYRAKDRDGKYVWLRCRGEILDNDRGMHPVLAGALTRLDQLNEADKVTGLLNKEQFGQAIREALDEFRRSGMSGEILLLGLDNFKIINETYNRSFGDEVLRVTAEQIQNILPEGTQLYKLDGDVFGVVLPGAGEGQVMKYFKAIQKCMSRQQFIDGKMYFCTVSGGTVAYPQGGKEYQALYKHAEAALDLAKRDGKNQNVFFTREQYNRWMRSLTMRDTIKTSVENGCEGFSLFYQPQVDAVSRRLKGAEALLRWKNPKGRMVAPMEFVPILEETKMILPLGKWIVREALKTCVKWRKVVPDFTMSINVSYAQIKDITFFSFVRDVIREYELPPEALTLELTESTIVSDWSFLNQQFDEFRQEGIHIAMDDFGTGYSSLAYLKNLSCDIVKVDREFVKHIIESEFDRELVQYTVTLCHGLGMQVCIEGVEEKDVYDIVTKDCGADYIQGYLFGRPFSEADFVEQYLTKETLEYRDVKSENR
ncbi:putative bifunctional diguanylate cyclase/phosphodiesterase [Schwartzia sp. (in: firmicutes)]